MLVVQRPCNLMSMVHHVRLLHQTDFQQYVDVVVLQKKVKKKHKNGKKLTMKKPIKEIIKFAILLLLNSNVLKRQITHKSVIIYFWFWFWYAWIITEHTLYLSLSVCLCTVSVSYISLTHTPTHTIQRLKEKWNERKVIVVFLLRAIYKKLLRLYENKIAEFQRYCVWCVFVCV